MSRAASFALKVSLRGRNDRLLANPTELASLLSQNYTLH